MSEPTNSQRRDTLRESIVEILRGIAIDTNGLKSDHKGFSEALGSIAFRTKIELYQESRWMPNHFVEILGLLAVGSAGSHELAVRHLVQLIVDKPEIWVRDDSRENETPEMEAGL